MRPFAMLDVSSTSVFLGTCVVGLCIFKWLGFLDKKRYPNGPWGVPVFGHLPFFGESPLHTFQRWRETYGDVYKIRMGGWNTVVVNGYTAIRDSASCAHDSFSGRPSFLTQKVFKERNNGEDSLPLCPFDSTYLFRRKVTDTAWRMIIHNRNSSIQEIISEEARRLVNCFIMNSKGKSIAVGSDVQLAVGRVVYQLLYGQRQHANEKQHLLDAVTYADEISKFYSSGLACEVMPWLRFVMPWKIRQLVNIANISEYIWHEQVEEHRKNSDANDIKDVTDAFIAADKKGGKENGSSRLTTNRLMSTLSDLFAAGLETTTRTLEWMILYMIAFPDVQQKVQCEIDDVIENGRAVDMNDRAKLPFSNATIHEVMRMRAVFPCLLPHCTTRDTTLNGFDIDKDTVVLFNVHSSAFDKEFWGDPEHFRPERLINNDGELDLETCKHILPFGIGRRRCAGEQLAKMEIFMFFVTLLQRCSFTKSGDNVELDLAPVPGLVYRPKPFRAVVKERRCL